VIRYTIDDIMREKPCPSYPLSRVSALWGGAESLSPAEIARLPIPVLDRIWALGRLLFRLSPPRACRVARLIALDVLDLWDPPDIVVWFLCTGDEQARVSARAAVGEASWDAWATARATARSAAAAAEQATIRDAAWAARDAARALARVATGTAAEDATRASVRSAARKKYLSWVVKAFDPFTPVGDLS